MTEKRFEGSDEDFIESNRVIWDDKMWGWLSVEEVEDLLNEQHETIQKLKEDLAYRSNQVEILKHILLQYYTLEEIEAELI